MRRSAIGMTSRRARLARAPLAALRTFSGRDTGIGDDGLEALLRAPRLALMREVDVAGCGLGPDAADGLLASGRMDHLKRVVWTREEPGEPGLAWLLAGPRVPGPGGAGAARGLRASAGGARGVARRAGGEGAVLGGAVTLASLCGWGALHGGLGDLWVVGRAKVTGAITQACDAYVLLLV